MVADLHTSLAEHCEARYAPLRALLATLTLGDVAYLGEQEFVDELSFPASAGQGAKPLLRLFYRQAAMWCGNAAAAQRPPSAAECVFRCADGLQVADFCARFAGGCMDAGDAALPINSLPDCLSSLIASGHLDASRRTVLNLGRSQLGDGAVGDICEAAARLALCPELVVVLRQTRITTAALDPLLAGLGPNVRHVDVSATPAASTDARAALVALPEKVDVARLILASGASTANVTLGCLLGIKDIAGHKDACAAEHEAYYAHEPPLRDRRWVDARVDEARLRLAQAAFAAGEEASKQRCARDAAAACAGAVVGAAVTAAAIFFAFGRRSCFNEP